MGSREIAVRQQGAACGSPAHRREPHFDCRSRCLRLQQFSNRRTLRRRFRIVSTSGLTAGIGPQSHQGSQIGAGNRDDSKPENHSLETRARTRLATTYNRSPALDRLILAPTVHCSLRSEIIPPTSSTAPSHRALAPSIRAPCPAWTPLLRRLQRSLSSCSQNRQSCHRLPQSSPLPHRA
jgi:hypothetical protein